MLFSFAKGTECGNLTMYAHENHVVDACGKGMITWTNQHDNLSDVFPYKIMRN